MNTAQLRRLNATLKARGIQIETRAEALARLGDGDRVFVFHLMDEEPFEVMSPAIVSNYLPEQMMALTLRVPIRRPDDSELSMAWGTFNQGEIARDDEADIFEDDNEAIEYVRLRAAEGSARHIKALRMHEADCRRTDPRHWRASKLKRESRFAELDREFSEDHATWADKLKTEIERRLRLPRYLQSGSSAVA